MLPNEMIADVRVDANMPSAEGRASDSVILRHVNRGQAVVASKFIAADIKHFEIDELLDFVGGQELYDIPSIIKDQKLSLIERQNVPAGTHREVGYIPFQDKEQYHAPGASQFGSAFVYYLRGRKIGFKPIPASSEVGAVKVYGIQHPHDMIWFKAQGVAGSAFVIPLTTDATNMKAGRTSMESNYYKNAVFRAITGAGIGQERTCTSYDPATRTITCSAPMTPIATNDELVLLSKIPDEYHETMIAYGAMKVAESSQDQDRFELARGRWDRLYTLMSAALKPRHVDRPMYLEYPGDSFDEGF